SASGGRLAKARELNRQAIDLAQHANRKEEAAIYEAAAAWSEVLSGNMELASRQARQALELSTNRHVEGICAVVLALASDAAGATRLDRDLQARFPEDTRVRFLYLPEIRAAGALQRSDAPGAIDNLTPTARYDMDYFLPGSASTYLRGL